MLYFILSGSITEFSLNYVFSSDYDKQNYYSVLLEILSIT